MTNSVTFIGELADKQFKNWQERANAYYLNIKGKRAMLHITNCPHLGDAEGMNSASNPKICSSNPADLKIWANDNDKEFETCSDCIK